MERVNVSDDQAQHTSVTVVVVVVLVSSFLLFSFLSFFYSLRDMSFVDSYSLYQSFSFSFFPFPRFSVALSLSLCFCCWSCLSIAGSFALAFPLSPSPLIFFSVSLFHCLFVYLFIFIFLLFFGFAPSFIPVLSPFLFRSFPYLYLLFSVYVKFLRKSPENLLQALFCSAPNLCCL